MMRYMMIYMAAGNSRRFGSNKLLYELGGKPLYRHGLETLIEFSRTRENVWLSVITQYEEIFHTTTQMAKGRRDISVFLNPDSRSGVSYTIRRGVEEAQRAGDFDYYLFVTADQPWLGCKTLEKFLKAGEEGRFPVVSACWKENGRLGNPVMFHRELGDELLKLQGDTGGRQVWKRHALEGGLVEVETERELEDVDVLPLP